MLLPNELIPQGTDDPNTRSLKYQWQYHLGQREAAQKSLEHQQAELLKPPHDHTSHQTIERDITRLEGVIADNTTRMAGIIAELDRMAAPPVPPPPYVSEKAVKLSRKGKTHD